MPTVFSHAIIGLAAGSVFRNSGVFLGAAGERAPARTSWSEELRGGRIPPAMRFIALSVMCATLPDLDVVGFALDVPYAHAFGHRGFFHSIFFALIVAVCTVVVFFPRARISSSTWWLLGSYFFVLTASHGFLDTLTSGGLGIALLAPFDNTRYLAPIKVFQAAPLDISGLITPWGWRCLRTELILIWVPGLAITLRSGWAPVVYRTSEEKEHS